MPPNAPAWRWNWSRTRRRCMAKAKAKPSVIIFDLNFEDAQPLELIAQAEGQRRVQRRQPDRLSVARAGRVEAGRAGGRLRHGDGALGIFAESAADPETPLRRRSNSCDRACVNRARCFRLSARRAGIDRRRGQRHALRKIARLARRHQRRRRVHQHDVALRTARACQNSPRQSRRFVSRSPPFRSSGCATRHAEILRRKRAPRHLAHAGSRTPASGRWW